MKFKKIICLSLISIALISCQNNEANIPVKVSTIDSKIYFGALSAGLDLPTYYFSDTKDIPYVSSEDYFINALNNALDPSKKDIGYKLEGNSIINKLTSASLVFDVKNNCIYSDDMDQFISSSSNRNDPINILSLGIDTTAQYTDKTTYTKGNRVSFNLDKYNATLKEYDNKIFIPFSFLETIIGEGSPMRFVFNGNDYYLYLSQAMRKQDGTYTEYGEAFYSGALTKNKVISVEYANYNYNSFLFTLENFYGRYSKLNISSLDKKLDEAGYKSLINSTDSSISNKAMADVINKYFNDGGHTAFVSRGFGCTYDADFDKKLQYEILNYDSRLAKTKANDEKLKGLRGEEKLTNNLVISGETAVIRFDSFSLNALNLAPTIDNVTTDKTSTFAIIYNSFKTIKENPSIKNVVFDVTLNGGGAAPALGEALSFMTNDPIEITIKNTLSNSLTTAVINYDNDLDGDFNDNDSYEGEYNFYIMTSCSSFSCGNEFPVLAKEYGYARIIGQTSGGGDCSTTTFISPDATMWAMSTYKCFTSKDDTLDFDKGATPDYELDSSYFYDIEKLNTYLNSISSNK